MNILKVLENQIEYHGHVLRVFEVHIDGQPVSSSFQSFHASTHEIVSSICQECYAASSGSMPSCGSADILVRRHGEMVYWFLAGTRHESPLLPYVPENDSWTFSTENYEEQLQSDTSSLMDFDSADLSLILARLTVYSANLGLFTMPGVVDDPQGRQLLDSIAQIVQCDDLAVSPPPQDICTVTIGIESEGIPLVTIEIGKTDRRYAIRLVSNPEFPLWITSSKLHGILNQYSVRANDQIERLIRDHFD